MADIMNGAGPSGGLGRGNQDAKVKVGNDKLRAPITTSTFDARDKGHAHLHQNIAASRETPPVKPGRGNHDHSIMGG